jgi:hypothetical protein
MKQQEVNSLILDEVDEIENEMRREFIDWILRFERSKMDRESPHYKDDFKKQLKSFDLEQYESK